MLVHFIVNGMPGWCTSLAISFILHYHSYKCIITYKHSHFILIHILPFLSIALPSNLWGPELNFQPWEPSSKIEVICVFVFKDLVGWCKSNSYLIKKWWKAALDYGCNRWGIQDLNTYTTSKTYVSNYLIKMATCLKTVDFFYNMNHVWKINKNRKHNLKLWSIHTQKKTVPHHQWHLQEL